MAYVDWYIEGKAFGNCNCVYGCPCQFEDNPTDGYCRGFEVLHIDKGHFGDTDLAGIRTAILYAWPGPVFEGNGEMQAVIDESANDAQREALRTVLHGGETEEVKTHWWVFHAMCSKVHDTLYKPIDCEVDIEARIDIPGGIEFDFAEVGSASTKATGAIKLDLNDSYGQWHTMRHAPAGVVR